MRRRPLCRRPRVSVVIPCYNYGRYLPLSVGSALHDQPGIDVEVVIVDDKSTDDSARAALRLAAADPRVRVLLHEANKGHIATYNDGLEAAGGEFVALLSADDLLAPGALTRAAELLAANEAVGLVYGAAVPFSGIPPAGRRGDGTWVIWPGAEWLRLRCRSGYNVIASPEVMMRAELLRRFGGYRPDLPHAGDFEMWLRTAAVADVGYLLGADQAYYRQHANNMNVSMFSAGTSRGQLIDLEQRWRSFEAVFDGVGRNLAERASLQDLARRTLSRQSLRIANYAFARGFDRFPVGEFETLARRIFADVALTPAGRALARRKRFGMVRLPLHPLWAASALAWRMEEVARRWRRRVIGV